MSYIIKDDILFALRESELDEITTNDTVIQRAIDIAEEECKAVVGHRFDLTIPSFKMKSVMVDIAIFHLYKLIAHNKIPSFRVWAYNGTGGEFPGCALWYLQSLTKGAQTTILPVKLNEDGTEKGSLIEVTSDHVEESKLRAW